MRDIKWVPGINLSVKHLRAWAVAFLPKRSKGSRHTNLCSQVCQARSPRNSSGACFAQLCYKLRSQGHSRRPVRDTTLAPRLAQQGRVSRVMPGTAVSQHRWLWPYLLNALRNKESAEKITLYMSGEPREDRRRPNLTASAHVLCAHTGSLSCSDSSLHVDRQNSDQGVSQTWRVIYSPTLRLSS